MESQEWFEFPSDRRDTETLVRAWKPGDGMTCSHRTSRAKVSCGAPVALVKRVTTSIGYRSPRIPEVEVRRTVVCSHHVANVIKGAGYAITGITTDAEKEAREAVLAAHWEEYQKEFATRVKAKRDGYLEKLPESLRVAFEEIESTKNEEQ
ncbi:hypothetical protein ACTXJX_12700 [Glutamicibacter ardleyensis]|uniref:hypothetical protein n=1 Tax=Glutamicibacter ardleyensis TaxID=225894 RepID=UPI003FD433D4